MLECIRVRAKESSAAVIPTTVARVQYTHIGKSLSAMEPATEQKLLEEPALLTQFGLSLAFPAGGLCLWEVVCCLRCAKERIDKFPLHGVETQKTGCRDSI